MDRISEGNGGDAPGGDFSLIGSNGDSSGMMSSPYAGSSMPCRAARKTFSLNCLLRLACYPSGAAHSFYNRRQMEKAGVTSANPRLRFRRDTSRYAGLADFYRASGLVSLRGSYRQILGPCRHLSKLANGLCRYSDVWHPSSYLANHQELCGALECFWVYTAYGSLTPIQAHGPGAIRNVGSPPSSISQT
jgi:hypothetical protein